MPDFTIETAWVCRTSTEWQIDITGSHGNVHTVRWERDYRPNAPAQYHYTCDCRGYNFRKTCSHIVDADKIRCGWNEESEPTAEPVIIDGEPRCPVCKGPVDAMRVAV